MFWWLALVAIVLVLYFVLFRQDKNLPPVVQYGPIPYLSTLLKYKREPQELIAWAHKKYGKVFTISIFGLMHMTFVSSDEGLETFFKAKEEKLSLGDAAKSFVSFLVRDEDAKPEPKIEDPEKQKQYNTDWIRDSITTENKLQIIYEKIQDEVQNHVAQWEKMDKIPLVEAITKLVVAINIRSFVSDDGREYADEITKLYQTIEDKGTSTSSVFIPWSESRKTAVNAKKEMIKIISKIMAKRMEFLKDHPDEKPLDIMQTNINLGKSAAGVTSALLGIFFAAHVNTVSTNIWTILHLAQDAKWQEQLCQELDNLGTLEFDALKRMEILGNMIKETVRTHALVQMMRQVRQPVTIDGYTIPVGHFYMISPLLVHYDENTFENPSNWNPDRFKGKNYGYRFIQWGFGPHRCLGEHYAYMVIRTLIANIFSKYHVRLESEQVPAPLYEKLLGMAPPSKEVYIRLEKRK